MQPAEDHDGRKKSPRINVPRSLDDVINDVKRMESALTKMLEIVERLLGEIYVIELALKGGATTAARRRPGPKPPAPAGPAPLAQNFCLEALKKGGAAVSFAGGKRVVLPPALAALIAILASGGEGSPDELVAWKSLDRIGQLLEEQLRRKYNHHAVLQLLSRLRAAFRGEGLDPRLIESAPALGARLRLKRRPAALCAG